MKSCSLPKTKLLRKTRQYREVYSRGRRLYGQDFGLVYVSGTEGASRLGISIHGVKKATRRNRIKRIVRECFRLHGQELSQIMDVVVTVRQGFDIDSSEGFYQAIKILVKGTCPAMTSDCISFPGVPLGLKAGPNAHEEN